MTNFPSPPPRHVTASRLKILQQQQQQPPNTTFPFLLMAFVFAHVTRLGPAAMSQTAQSGNRISQKGSLSQGKSVCGGKEGKFLAHCFDQQWQLWQRSILQARLKPNRFYLQNERCDVRSIRAQIRYRIQFIVVQLSVHIWGKEKRKRVCQMHSDAGCLEKPVFTL